MRRELQTTTKNVTRSWTVRVPISYRPFKARRFVWGHRYALVWGAHEADDLKVIDLDAGCSSSGETLYSRVIGALKSEVLLNESVGAGYIERNWPPAFQESGVWPLASLRQSFLDASLTRAMDADMILRGKIADFVANGERDAGRGRFLPRFPGQVPVNACAAATGTANVVTCPGETSPARPATTSALS